MGLIAVFSVIVNLVIIVGVLASFKATMTLPGIAALVLTIGMAVDSNILVFERMREETFRGKNLWASLTAGYDKAFSTIVDANLTTLISAGALWAFGTGPVKGFGLTLAIGIFTTLFCCLILSRALLELSIKNNIIKKALSKGLISGDANFPFLKYAKASFIISWTVVIIGVAVLISRGDKTLSIDFTGGDIVAVSFNPDKKIPIENITALSTSTSDEGIGEIQASYQTDLATRSENLVLQVESEKGQKVFDLLAQKFPDAGLKLVSQQSIGASVSGDITRDAFIAVALSLLLILAYVAFRFELSYGIGAIIATFHDVVVTIGPVCDIRAFRNRLWAVLGAYGCRHTYGHGILDQRQDSCVRPHSRRVEVKAHNVAQRHHQLFNQQDDVENYTHKLKHILCGCRAILFRNRNYRGLLARVYAWYSCGNVLFGVYRKPRVLLVEQGQPRPAWRRTNLSRNAHGNSQSIANNGQK